MNPKQLRKEHPELFRLWVESKKALRFGDSDPGPIPQKDKNYIISIVNDQRKCFSVIEYNDGWATDDQKGKVQDVNVPSREVISFQSQDISENEFIALLIDIMRVYSSFELDNDLIACFRTNGAGKIVFDAVKSYIQSDMTFEDIKYFPTARRTKSGKELFTRTGRGWEMTAAHEKDCLDSMKTAEEQRYFVLATDNSKNMFQMTSVDYSEQKEIDSFMYVWMMISFIRLNMVNLF
jgi:hypothetical protein